MKAAASVPVLMYHHVSPSPGLVTVTPAHFTEQIARLAASGYRTLDADAFAAYLDGKPVPDKSIVISFDDGYLDNWVYAHPVLKKHAFKALLFVVTDWIKDGPLRPHAGETLSLPETPEHNACKQAIADGRSDEVIVRWSEVEAMKAAGTFDCHSHTHTHTRWDKLHSEAGQKRLALTDDLAAARRTLERRLGASSNHLCWPQGYFDQDYLDAAHAAGYRHLYTIAPGANCPGQDRDRIRRIVVKDKSANWLLSRLWIYRRPKLAAWYVRGKDR